MRRLIIMYLCGNLLICSDEVHVKQTNKYELEKLTKDLQSFHNKLTIIRSWRQTDVPA